MSVPYPDYAPSSRVFTMPTYSPLDVGFAGNKIAYPYNYKSRGVDAKLSLGYQNIDDSTAALFVTCYSLSLSGFLSLDLPVSVVAGIENAELATRIRQGQRLLWRFAGAPDVEQVRTSLLTVRVELVATLSQE
jgi:hypothetical protein